MAWTVSHARRLDDPRHARGLSLPRLSHALASAPACQIGRAARRVGILLDARSEVAMMEYKTWCASGSLVMAVVSPQPRRVLGARRED